VWRRHENMCHRMPWTYNSKYIMSASATPIVSLKIFGSGFHLPVYVSCGLITLTVNIIPVPTADISI